MVWRKTVTRNLPVAADAAYAWFTEYTPDDVDALGYGGGTRKVSRIDEHSFRLLDRHSEWGRALEFDGEVRLAPPDRWRWTAIVRYNGKDACTIEGDYRITPKGKDGSEVSAAFVAKGSTTGVKLYLALMGGRISRRVERTYDRLARAIAAETLADRPTPEER